MRPRQPLFTRRVLLTGGAATAAYGLAAAPRRPAWAARVDPIRIHPENPRYFLWRGKPRVLIGASEHFGAVVNREFDMLGYLDVVASHGFNVTRIFTGTLVEPYLGGNTLEPAGEAFLAPWARSAEPGYSKGGNKFDLTRFDPAYFQRLRSFVGEAGKRGVVVILTLFTQHWDEGKWSAAPFNPRNNVNGFAVTRHDVYTLDRHKGLLPIAEAMVRKLVDELRFADNVIFEMTYSRSRDLLPADWERHMTDVLFAAQRRVGDRKIVAVNLGRGREPGEVIDPRIGLLGHNMAEPSVLETFPDDPRPLGNGETGFVPSTDRQARFRAWDFVLRGAGLFIHMDLTFAVKDQRGRRLVTKPDATFGGGPVQRQQLQALVEIVNQMDFVRMRPAPELVKSTLPPQLAARVFAEPGRSYLVYVRPTPTPTEISARWTGKLVARKTGPHTLLATSNDGVRLWIDGQLVVDNWKGRARAEDAAQVALQAGKAHDLKLEYFYEAGAAEMRLEWQEPGAAGRELVPSAQLRTPDGAPGGLQAEYFGDSRLGKLHVVRRDPGIDYGARSAGVFEPPPWTPGPLALDVEVTEGVYRLEWLDPASGGRYGDVVTVQHPGGALRLEWPRLVDDIAARLQAAGPG